MTPCTPMLLMNGELVGYDCQCARCNYHWRTRTPRRPRLCAKCRSAYWDQERLHPKPATAPLPARECPDTSPDTQTPPDPVAGPMVGISEGTTKT